MQFQNQRFVGILEVLLAGAFYGLIPIFVRFGSGIDSISLVFFRALFGVIFVFLIIKLLGKNLAAFKEEKLNLIIFSIISLLAIGSYFLALKFIDIASAVLLLYTYSIWIVIFSWLWLKEKIGKYTLIALLLAILGVVLIISPSGFKFEGNSIGYIIALMAGIFACFSYLFPKKYLKNYDAYSITFYQALFILPILIVPMMFSPPNFTLTNIGVFAGLGLFCTALAFSLVYGGSRKISGQHIGILLTSEIVVPIILGAILFSEVPLPVVIIGGVLLVAGYFITIFTQ